MRHFKMDNSLENVFDSLGLSDGENVDMLTPHACKGALCTDWASVTQAQLF